MVGDSRYSNEEVGGDNSVIETRELLKVRVWDIS